MSDQFDNAPAVAPFGHPSEDDPRRRRVTTRGWVAIGAAAVVVAGVVVTAGILSAENRARDERVAAAQSDFSAFSAARANWTSAQDDYVSVALSTAADVAVYRTVAEKVQSAEAFDLSVVAEFDRVVTELIEVAPGPSASQDAAEWETSVRDNPATTLGLEEPAISTLTEQEAIEAYAAGDDAFRAAQASLADGVAALTDATQKVEAEAEELVAAHQRVVGAGIALAAASTINPDDVLAQMVLAMEDSKATFVAAHASLAALTVSTGAQELLDAVTSYLESYEAVRVSNEEAVAEAERIRREQVGTITVLTDFMVYLPYDQCIQAPGVAYTQTFDVSGGQNHTTAPDPAQDFDIWTYAISGGTVSYLRCYAD